MIDYDPRGRRVTFVQDVEDHDLLEDAEVPPKDMMAKMEMMKNLLSMMHITKMRTKTSLLKFLKDMSNHMGIKSMKMMNSLILIYL